MKLYDLILSIISVTILFGISIKYLMNREGKRSSIFKMLLIIFSVRIIFAILYFGLQLPPNLPDTRTFEEAISNFIGSGFDFSAIQNRFDVRNYIVFSTTLRLIFGNTWIVTVGINSLLGSFAIYYASKIAKEIGGEKSSILALIFLCIEPTCFLYTNTHLREAIVLLTIVIAFYNLVKYMKSNEKKYMVLFFVVSIISGLFRAVNIFVLFIAGTVGVIISIRKSELKNKKTLKVIAVLGTIIVFGVILLNVVLGFSIDIEYINQNLQRDAIGGGTLPYLIGERYESWTELVMCIPKRLFYFVLYPFPWIVKNYAYIVATVSSLYNMIFITLGFAILLKNFKTIDMKNKKWNIVLKIFIVLLVTLIIYAVAKTEAAARHRLQFIWMIPVLVASIVVWKEEKYKLCD